jgi:FtsP/CotA-like multicopper oxidase with cupredoxin domain
MSLNGSCLAPGFSSCLPPCSLYQILLKWDRPMRPAQAQRPRKKPEFVRVTLEANPVTGLLADGIGYQYWTYNGTVPGPMTCVRQGIPLSSP